MTFDSDKFERETAPALVAASNQFNPDKFEAETNQKPQTLESKYLEPNAYPVAGALARGFDMASTPVQDVLSIPIQAAIAMQKGLTGQPQDEFINPLTNPIKAANKYGSTKALFNQYEGMTKPIAPGFTSEQFPKAASMMSQTTLSDIAALPSDVALTHGMTKAIGLTGVPDVLSDWASKNREEALVRASSLGAQDTAKIANDLIARRVGDTLNRYGLDNHLIMPDLLKGKLSGKPVIGTSLTGSAETQFPDRGLIGEVGKKVGTLKDSVNSQVPNMSANDLIERIVNEAIGDRNNPNSGTPSITDDQVNQMYKKASSIVKPEFGDKSFSDLVDLKRSSQAEVAKKTPEQRNADALKDPTMNTIKGAMWKVIDNHQNEVAKILPDASDFVNANSDYHDLKLAENIVRGGKLDAINVPSLPESLLMLELTKDITPMAAGRNLRQNIGFWSRKLPAIRGAVQQGMSNAMIDPLSNPIKTTVPAISATARQQYSNLPQDQPMQTGRVPQSVSNFKNTLPMKLVSYQIPRDSNDILANKNVVLAKIAQMSGDDPTGMVPMFQDALENHPEKLPKVLPALIMKFPDLFASDDYNRIDNKILDPQMKAKALKDLGNDRTMDIRTKAFKAKRLQEESILD
jgi:hypothetical protein